MIRKYIKNGWLNMSAAEMGDKFDEDPYEKVDLSLIPWDILSLSYPDKKERAIAKAAHDILNSEEVGGVNALLNFAIDAIGMNPLAIALGYGVVKYGRNNWKKGFGGNPRRFLRATLRHCDAYLRGNIFDGQAIAGYPQGNHHQGAISFSLMVADNEQQGEDDDQ